MKISCPDKKARVIKQSDPSAVQASAEERSGQTLSLLTGTETAPTSGSKLSRFDAFKVDRRRSEINDSGVRVAFRASAVFLFLAVNLEIVTVADNC